MRESKSNRFFKLKIARPRNFKIDVLSGLTVALALVPEAVAFSFVAHVDPRVGLYAAFMMGFITAVLGGRPGMISGATGAVAVIFAPLMIQQTALVGTEGALGYLFAAVALMGVLQILFGVFKLGKFIRLVPHPVMLGFVNGLAIIIFKAQFSQFYEGTGANATLITGTPLAIMIAMIALVMFISHFLPKITKSVPATLVGIVVVTLIAIALEKFGIHSCRNVLDFVKDMDPSKTTIAADIPSFAVPAVPFTFETIQIILPFAFLAAAVGLIESLMTLSLVDELTETRGRGNKESIGQGVANLFNGFFGGMGGCAMIGQSMINIRGGGRGRTSGITAAVCLFMFVIWGSALVEIIPLAALIGVMFMVAIGTFEWSSFRVMSKIPKADAFVIILVSAVTVFADLAIAVIVGIIVSALVFAWNKSTHIFHTTSFPDDHTKVYTLNGPLYFGSVMSFKEIFTFREDPDDVVINFENARVYDHSGLEAINNIAERYSKVGKKLHLLKLSKECSQLLDKAESIVEVETIDCLDWHIAHNRLA